MGEPTTEETVFLTLAKTGISKKEAFKLYQAIQDMAAANLIYRFESKLEAQGEKLQAAIEAQGAAIEAQGVAIEAHAENSQRQFSLLRWMIGIGITACGIGIAACGVIIAFLEFWPD